MEEIMQTKVKDLMKSNPATISPDSSLREAAQKMESIDCGVLPVGNSDDPEGIITDRDIVLRAVAKGRDVAKEKVKDYMTMQVFSCNEDDTLEDAAKAMHENHVNRLLVKDGSGKMSGILSFGCILRKEEQMEDIQKVLECTVGKKAA
jgi:CBS domain-containing protein